jgi:Spy/CpxP family protein refolding chaperone
MTEVSTTAVSTNATRKAALWVGVVFLLGAALGGVLGYLFAHRPVIAANPPLSEPERRAQKLQELTKELSLTPQQAQQVDSILMQRHAEAKAIHDQTDAQLLAVRQRGRAQMRAVLTPEQVPKFEAFLQRMDEERKRNGPQPPPSR